MYHREKEEDKEMAEFLRLKLMPLEKKLKVTQSERNVKNGSHGQKYCGRVHFLFSSLFMTRSSKT